MFTDDEMLKLNIPRGAFQKALEFSMRLHSTGMPLPWIADTLRPICAGPRMPKLALSVCEHRNAEDGAFQAFCHALICAWEDESIV